MTVCGSISIAHCCVYAQREGNGPAGFGIDKLRVRIEDFLLDDWRPWNDKTAPARKAGELAAPPPVHVMTVAGKDIYNGLYFNDPQGKYVAEVVLDPKGRQSCFLTLNPSKIHGHLTTDPNILHEVLQAVSEDMKRNLSTEIHLPTAAVSRIDLAADARLTYPVNTYAEAIRGSKARPNAPQAEYPNGFLFGSGSGWQTCTYDRGKKNVLDDLTRHGQKIPANIPASNLMRNEARFHNADTVKRHGNGCCETYGALLEAQPAELYRMYLKPTEHFLKIHQPRIVFPAVEHTQLHNTLTTLLNIAPRTAINDFLACLTVEENDLHTIDWRALIADA
ncbi:MAG: hypothetical protein ACK5XN_39270, partial [Bacteroidota bacterium]